MTTTPVTAQPFTLKDVSLTLTADGDSFEFREEVSAVTFTPSSSQVSWNGLGQNAFTDVTTPTWACNVSYAQNWEDDDSLALFLFNHQGETVAATFKPRRGGTKVVNANIIITPGAIGGTFGQVATADVTLGVDGKPTIALAV